jgi:NitT/TauT family transport system permease protein
MTSVSAGRRAISQPIKILAAQAAIFATFFIVVQLLSLFTPLIPSVPELVWSFVGLLTTATFYFNLGITLYEAALGLTIAFILGVSIGIFVGASRAATETINPIILASYSVPKIIFLPLLLILLGAGLEPKIANAALHALFPILLNTMVGMREVNPLFTRVARSLGGGRKDVILSVYLPSIALPVLTGVRLAVGLSVMGALLAELFQSNSGIGYMILQVNAKGQISLMLSIVFAMFLLILCVNYAMKKLEHSVAAWSRVNERD